MDHLLHLFLHFYIKQQEENMGCSVVNTVGGKAE